MVNPIRKNRVSLLDYNYRHDIGNRLLMSNFTLFEIDVLQEILNHSLTFSISELTSALGVTRDQLSVPLNNLLPTKVFSCKGDQITVDKEMRKYYEGQIGKFDDQHAPGFDYLFTLLRRLPIHLLPEWYAIPRTSSDILSSISEQYLSTPKIYERYLSELVLTDPTAHFIMRDVFASPELKVSGNSLRKKYKLSRERFEELLLQLEFNFVCCLGYNRNGDRWEEVVTPFREWRDYLLFQKEHHPQAIPADDVKGSEEFGFIKDLTALLRVIEQGSIPVRREANVLSVDLKSIGAWMPRLAQDLPIDIPTYLQTLVDRLIDLGLVHEERAQLQADGSAKEWHKKSIQEQALSLYRLPLLDLKLDGIPVDWSLERGLREVERSLKPLVRHGWVLFDDFIKSLMQPIGHAAPVVLKQVGRRWRYELPKYGREEVALVRWAIVQKLFEAGFVAIGEHKKRFCFMVTPFGRMAIGD